MGAKDQKLTKMNYPDRDEYNQSDAFDSIDNTFENGLFLAEVDIGDFILTPDLEDNSRQREVKSIFESIFGRVGCYNCGLAGLDVKLNPEDIIQFDTQARLTEMKSAIHDS